MSNEIVKAAPPMSAIEKVVIGNDLSALKPDERFSYYKWRCESIGLDAAARPFQYITFQGKLTLYPDKGCAEQLRAVHGISSRPINSKKIDDVYMVEVEATARDGRTAVDVGAVSVAGLRGDDLAKAIKKATTQGHRRATFALVGLGAVDVDDMGGVVVLDPKAVEETNLLPALPPKEEQPKHTGPVDWQEPDKWPPDQPTIVTGKVLSCSVGEKDKKRWVNLTIDDGITGEVKLSTFHMSAQPMLEASVGRIFDIMYAKKAKGCQLLSIKEVEAKATSSPATTICEGDIPF